VVPMYECLMKNNLTVSKNIKLLYAEHNEQTNAFKFLFKIKWFKLARKLHSQLITDRNEKPF
jgi:hypothetical protein